VSIRFKSLVSQSDAVLERASQAASQARFAFLIQWIANKSPFFTILLSTLFLICYDIVTRGLYVYM
jgi:hypothetical protein